jgi:hypothetical protein
LVGKYIRNIYLRHETNAEKVGGVGCIKFSKFDMLSHFKYYYYYYIRNCGKIDKKELQKSKEYFSRE